MAQGKIIGADNVTIHRPGREEFTLDMGDDRTLIIARMDTNLHFELNERGRPSTSNMVSIGELFYALGVAGSLKMKPTTLVLGRQDNDR